MNDVQYDERRSEMRTETRREQQRQAVRETILDAARDALAEGGQASFSMRKLAETIGCSPGTIYLYFKAKEDLLDRLVEEAFEKLLEQLEEVHDEQDAVRSLRRKLRAYVDFGLRFPNHYHVAFVMRPPGREPVTTLRPHAAFDVLRAAVERCIEQRRFRTSDIESTSQLLWTAIHGITSLLIALPGFPWVERESLIDGVIDNAVRGLLGGDDGR